MEYEKVYTVVFICVYLRRFWRGMYCRHESGVHPREALADLLPAAVEHCSALEHHINYLTKVTRHPSALLGAYTAPRCATEKRLVSTSLAQHDQMQITMPEKYVNPSHSMYYQVNIVLQGPARVGRYNSNFVKCRLVGLVVASATAEQGVKGSIPGRTKCYWVFPSGISQ